MLTRPLLLATLASLLAASQLQAAESSEDLLRQGALIYNTATRGDGSPVEATVQFDVPIPPGQGACVSCHRRSGLGVAEGGSRTLNITGPQLFSDVSFTPSRPAYDTQTLTRAIVGGIAADGRTLDPLMPRYRLTASDSKALIAFLRELGSTTSPGVSADTLTIATVIAPDAPVYERQAIEAVISRFVEIKNSLTRNEAERAVINEGHEFGVNRYRAYRRWQHSFWRLEGSPPTWRAQLERYYEDATPFAMLSGSGGSQWSIINEFCEDHQLPCVLPVSNTLAGDGNNFYTLNYSSGVRLEAEVAALHLAKNGKAAADDVLIVYSDDESGRTAVEAFQRIWMRDKKGPAAVLALRAGATPNSARWKRYLTGKPTRFVVAFVDHKQMRSMMQTLSTDSPTTELVYTAESMMSWNTISPSMPMLSRVMHVYPYSLPTEEQGQFAREQEWLRAQGFGSLELLSATKALFACHVFGEALADIKTNFSRDYFMEGFEHALDGTQMTSLYPRTSAGPNQRTLARGAYVAGFLPDTTGIRLAGVDWIQP